MYLLERHVNAGHTNTASATQCQDKILSVTTAEDLERFTKTQDFKITNRYFFVVENVFRKKLDYLVSINKLLNNAKMRSSAVPILPSLSSVSNSAFSPFIC